MNLAQATQDLQDKKLSPSAFMRLIVEHDAWLVPGERAPDGTMRIAFIRPPSGLGRILDLFSSRETLEHCQRTTDDPTLSTSHFEVPGYTLFHHLPDQTADRINFDPLSPHTFRYGGDQLTLLKDWATTVSLETSLHNPDAFPNPLSLLKNYPSYTLVFHDDGTHQDLVLAPDNRGRSLAAIFTAQDTAKHFIQSLQNQDVHGKDSQLTTIQQPASQLFQLLRSIPLDGLVFNPLSHRPARAFSARILEQLTDDPLSP